MTTSSATLSAGAPRRYRFAPRDRAGLFLGLAATQCVLLAAGLLAAGALLQTTHQIGVALVPVAASALIAFGCWAQRPLHEWINPAVGWLMLRARHAHAWHMPVPLRVLARVPALPEFLGGSADLTGSNNTLAKGATDFTPENRLGRYVRYGVREHGMAAAMNGIALHGGFIPYGGTFLSFSDYSRPAIRLAALMGIRAIHVMTHDSIGLGEDGPTHQPVEHLPSLRAIPNLLVFRPADAVETLEAWDCALAAENRPSVLCLSRQAVPTFRSDSRGVNRVARGAYLVAAPEGTRDVTLIATGSEVAIALEASRLLAAEHVRAAVVSAPCFELFAEQPVEYRNSILGCAPRVGVEAAVLGEWPRWIGDGGEFVGMAGFGASAPARVLYEQFNITPVAVAEAARRAIARVQGSRQ